MALSVTFFITGIFGWEYGVLRTGLDQLANEPQSFRAVEYLRRQEQVMWVSFWVRLAFMTSVVVVSYRLFILLTDPVTNLTARLQSEKRRADTIASAISDGIFLIRNGEIVYTNPIADRILQPSGGKSLGRIAVENAISKTLPVEFRLDVDDRKFHYLLQSFDLPTEAIEKMNQYREESVLGQDVLLADTVLLAQDVTLVKESQEAKSHFMGTLSHEIKTPVTSLTMATRLLKKAAPGIPNTTVQHLIDLCVDDVDRLRGLLDDLLTVSRFDILTQRLELKQVDLAKLILHSVRSFQLQAGMKGIELIYLHPAPGKPVPLSIDATKIAWAFSNLMTNALRHTPRGGKVNVQLTLAEENIEVRVQDTGPGIEQTRQSRIFDKFRPYYDLRVARSGSVGASLAIAKELIIAHGGGIWVTSEVGQGAEFGFTLPLRKGPGLSVSKERPETELAVGAIGAISKAMVSDEGSVSKL